MAAENYHLKWDSHLSYLNTSIATLYKNEKFADVVLYSSYSNSSVNSDIPTVGISAHKFILSSCSQFFATMFETAPITSPNGVLYIVLPPDLSHRAIQILVQYMYSGEATVSNDILNEVLRGGEILKIRGLCRTSASSGSSSAQPSSSSAHHGHAQGGHMHQREREPSALYVPNGTRSALPPPPPPPQLSGDIYGNKTGSSSCSSARYAVEHHPPPHQHPHPHPHHHQQQQFRGLGASVMPKDSPVIVKSPKMAAHTGLLSVASSSKLHTSGGGISINKEVAIDPEDKCCYAPSQVESLPQPPTAAAVSAASVAAPMSICTEVGCNSCPLTAPSTESESALRRRDYGERVADEHALCDRDDVGLVYDRRLRRESACERAHDYFTHEAPHFEHVVKPYVGEPAPSRLTTPPHPHNFLNIKQEPTDWSNNPPAAITTTNNNIGVSELNNESALSPKQPLDFKISAVKLETNRASTPPDDSEEHTLRDYNNFKLLICEICQKSFEDTKTLVRHLGTHATEPAERNHATNICSSSNMTGSISNTSGSSSSNSLALRALKTYVPKKRRRVSQQENNMDHVTLLCDLCSTSFETPAEWVRHMNSQHTEIELAMFNSKKEGEQKSNASSTSTASSSQLQQQQAAAAAAAIAAHKKYASVNRQSLLLHKRSGNSSNGSSGTPATSLNVSPGLAATSSHA